MHDMLLIVIFEATWQRSAPVGYAAEYLIPSLSDVLTTIALPHSVTYLLRGVNGLVLYPGNVAKLVMET